MKIKIFTAVILLILIMGTVQASVIAIIGQEGLSFLNPTIQTIIKGVLCVSGPLGAITCVEQYVGGKIIGSVSGEIMQTIHGLSPEAYNSVVTYNKIKGYTDKGSKILKELEINEEGGIEKGVINFAEEESSIKEFFINLEAEDIVVSNSEYDFETKKLIIKEGGSLKIKIKDEEGEIQELVYENIAEDGYLKLGDDGLVKEARFISTGESVYKFGDYESIKVGANTQIEYKDGSLTVHGEGKNFLYGDLNISLMSEFADFSGNQIKCTNCIIEEIELKGIGKEEGVLILVDEGYLIMNGEAIYKQNLLKVNENNKKILIANPDADLSDYEGNWLRQTSNILEFQSSKEGYIELDFLEDHKILNTDNKDKLTVIVQEGDGLKFEERTKKGLIPKAVHKSSEEGETTILNDKIEAVFNKNGFFVIPRPLENKDFISNKYQSSAFEIESDALEVDSKLRINSYRQFVVLDKSDNEIITYNKYDLPVSAKIEDNELQTIEQLRKKHPGIEFEVPEKLMYNNLLTPNIFDEENLPPYMIYLTDTYLESNPDAVEDFDKIEYIDTFNAHATGSTMILGRKILEPLTPEFTELPLREITSPLQILKHEHEHRMDFIIAEKEWETLKSWDNQELNSLFDEIDPIQKKLNNLREQRDEHEKYSKAWGEMNGNVMEQGYMIEQIKYKIKKIVYDEYPEERTLRQKYNELVLNSIGGISNNKQFKQSFETLSRDIEENYVRKELNKIVEEKYGVDIIDFVKEKYGYETRDQALKEYMDDPFTIKKDVITEIYKEMQAEQAKGFKDIDREILQSERIRELVKLGNLLSSADELEKETISDGISIGRIENFYANLQSNPDLVTEKNQFNQIIRTSTGLPYTYALTNYGEFSDAASASYTELSAINKEQPIKIRRIELQSANPLISKMSKSLTQMAFDAVWETSEGVKRGKMSPEEYIKIMGKDTDGDGLGDLLCKSKDCIEYRCINHKPLCCEVYPSSPNC